MNTIKDTSSLHHNRSHLQTSSYRFIGDTGTSTLTTMLPVITHPHDNSVISMEENLPHGPLNAEENFEKFSASLLKNKTLLVSRHLALKRQRASLKLPKQKLRPVYSETLQMELGNPEGFLLNNDRNEGGMNTMTSQYIRLSPEQNRIQSTSNDTTPLRGDTPQTAPTDISLLYREKPLLSHPVTGHGIVQYAEGNGGPSPCSYVLPRKSCREKNAPAFTFGSRCLVEKKGGSRTGWQKQWFAHSDPYTTKVDFNREMVWPTPFHYPAKPTLGDQPTKITFPSWSIATRLRTKTTIAPENNPSPDTYDTTSAFRKLTAKNTHITFKSRPGGSQASTISATDTMPGPNAYDERKFLLNKYSAPKYSFGKRIPTSLGQDPYVNTLPSIES